MPTFTVPHLEKIRQCRNPWGAKKVRDLNAFFIPTEPVQPQLNIEPDSNVRVLGGAKGHWAAQLARHTNVDYSDISHEMTQIAEKEHKAQTNIRTFEVADALELPQKEYQYLFTFEPHPFSERLPLIALNAMAHGIRIRFVETELKPELLLPYGNAWIKTVHIKGKTGERAHIRPLDVLMANPYPARRHLARLDLEVMAALQHAPTNLQRIQAHLKEHNLAANPEQIKESLGRLNAVGNAIRSMASEQFTRPVFVDYRKETPAIERHKE